MLTVQMTVLPDGGPGRPVIEIDEATDYTDETLGRVLERVGEKTVEFLRSYTNERRPPVRSGGPLRPAHPGHWGDITHDLSRSYKAVVLKPAPSVFVLRFTNDSGHAIYLERREGFFVLTGIEERGGAVEVALRAAVAELAPDWRVV